MPTAIKTFPLSDGEKRRLKKYGNRKSFDGLIFSFVSLVMMAGGFLAIAIIVAMRMLTEIRTAEYQPTIFAASFAAGLILVTPSFWTEITQMFKKPETESKFAQDFAGGVANVEILQINRAIEIEEYEDEGVGFLLEIADGRVLSLIGQDYYDFAQDIDLEEGEEDLRGLFPQTLIEYRYAPVSGLTLDVRGIGESLRPTLKIKRTPKARKNRKTKIYEYVAPEDGQFYPGTLEDVCKQFGYAPVPI